MFSRIILLPLLSIGTAHAGKEVPTNAQVVWEEKKDADNYYRLTSKWFSDNNKSNLKYKIEFVRYPEKRLRHTNGYPQKVTFSFSVINIESLSGFDSGYFEGPDAPAEKHKLLALSATSSSGEKRQFMMTQAGSFVAGEKDKELAFNFNANYSSKESAVAITQFMQCIQKGFEIFTVSLYSPEKQRKDPIVSITCDARDMRPFAQRFLEGSSRP